MDLWHSSKPAPSNQLIASSSFPSTPDVITLAGYMRDTLFRFSSNQVFSIAKSSAYTFQPLIKSALNFSRISLKTNPHRRPFFSTSIMSSNVSESSLLDKLKTDKTLQASHIDIVDTSGGCGQSFNAVIVSDAFAGKSLLQRHRLINELLKDEISQMHAFSQKCYTTEQWQKLKQ